jgi:fibronectin-binding autotransporter adhesin
MNKSSNSNFSLRKLLITALVAAPLATLPAPLWALPSTASSNLSLTSGVSVATSGTNVLNVTATADKQVLTWGAFGSGGSAIGSSDSINYFLPSATSSILNLVTGGAATTIDGTIASNGNVFLLNPAGIVIGATGQINVGGFTASTVPDPLAAFGFTQNGTISLTGTPTAAITVNTGATLQAVGTGNNIKLYGKGVNLGGPVDGSAHTGAINFFGNLTVGSYGGTVAIGGVENSVNVSPIAGAGGNLTVVTGGSSIAGANIVLGGTTTSGVLTVVGNTSFDTTGTSNGNVTSNTGFAAFIASGSGTRVTINAGTGTSGGSVAIGNPVGASGSSSLAGLAVTAKDVSLVEAGNTTIYASTIAGNLTLTNASNRSFTSSGATSVAGTISVNTVSSLTFTGSGNLTFSALANGTSMVPNAVSITSTGDITVPALGAASGNTGNTLNSLGLTTTGGKITAGAITTVSTQSMVATGDITTGALSGTQLNITSSAGNITFGTVAVASTSSIGAAGNITLNTSLGVTNSGALTINAGGSIMKATAATALNLAGGANTITAASNIDLGTGTVGSTSNGAIALTATAGTITVGDINVTGTANTSLTAGGNISLPALTSAKSLTVNSTGGTLSALAIGNASTISLTAAGAVTLGGAIGNTTGTNTVTVTSTNSTITSSAAIAVNTTATFVAAGDIALDSITARNLNVTSTAGKLTQSAAWTSSTTTLNVFGDITLTNTSNNFANGAGTGATANAQRLTIIGGGGGSNGVQITDADNIVIGGATSVKGNLTLNTTGFVQLGTSVKDSANVYTVNGTDSLFFGGNVTINTGASTNATTNQTNPNSQISGTLNTFASNITILGAVSLTSTGNADMVLGTPTLTATSSYSYGSIAASLGAGKLSVTENTTLNLGNITAASVFANSRNADVVNTGKITATTVTVGAGTIFSGGNVTIANSQNAIGTVVINNAATANVAINGNGAVTVGGGNNIAGNAVNGAANLTNLTVAATGSTGTTVTVDLAASGGGSLSNISVSSPSGASVNIGGTTAPNTAVTLQNVTGGTGGTLTLTAANAVNLGSGIAWGGNVVVTSTGSSAAITDVAPNISIFGSASFTSDGGISITRSGHSIGPVSLVTTGAVNGKSTSITYTEAGTANLNVVTINSTSNASASLGNLTVVSTAGGIVQTGTTGVITANTTYANAASFTAAGAVYLANNGTGANNLAVPVTLTASGNSAIVNASGNKIQLGNVVVNNGSFVADAGAATITQTSGSTMFVFGNTAFKNTGANVITIGNSGNSFGAVSINAGSGNVTLTESGTLNIASIAGTGNFTLTSQNAGIIETANNYSGPYTGATFNAGITPTGASKNIVFNAGAAGISLNSGNDFGANNIKLVTTGNVTLQDGNANTVIASGTNIGGTFTVRNTANGTLKDNGGNVIATGNTLFDVGSGGIQFTGAGNSFGALQFRSGAATYIAEATTFNLAAGTVASGQVTLASNGDIITSGLGTSIFSGATTSLTLAAGGNITITNPIFVQNTLAFQASNGKVDLSALSLLGNLNGKTPTNLGAGTYVPPAP